MAEAAGPGWQTLQRPMGCYGNPNLENLLFSLPQSFWLREGWAGQHREEEVGFGQGGGVVAVGRGGRAAGPSPCLHLLPRLEAGPQLGRRECPGAKPVVLRLSILTDTREH